LYRGGLRRNWGPLNFFKPERGGFEKIQRDERRGALKIFTSLKETVVVKMYHKTTYIT
jgi:hypothetical protein